MHDIPALKQLLPHDHPMILIDDIVACREHGLTATVTIHEQSPFVESGGVPSWIGIEYMGQAIAAYAGLCARRDGVPVRIGFLVGSRRYAPGCSHFPLGATLQIAVDALTPNTSGLQVFECHISGAGIDTRANLNVFMPDDVTEFLQGESY